MSGHNLIQESVSINGSGKSWYLNFIGLLDHFMEYYIIQYVSFLDFSEVTYRLFQIHHIVFFFRKLKTLLIEWNPLSIIIVAILWRFCLFFWFLLILHCLCKWFMGVSDQKKMMASPFQTIHHYYHRRIFGRLCEGWSWLHIYHWDTPSAVNETDLTSIPKVGLLSTA